MTSVLSATPLYRAVVRLTLWEWLNALVGCDVPSVKAAVTGLMPSRPRNAGPRASRRIGTSSEASWYGSGPSLLRLCLDVVRGGPGLGCGGFACGCILVSLFTRSKQFFWFLLRVPLFLVSDSSPRALGGSASTLLDILMRLGSQQLPSGLCLVLEASVGARERTHRV